MPTSRRIVTCTACHLTAPHHAHGWCNSCNARWRSHGRPESGPPAPDYSHGGGVPTDANDVDELAVDLAVKGHRPELNPGERRAAVAQLHARGLTGPAIADRLGCATRTVERHLAALKTAATIEGNRS